MKFFLTPPSLTPEFEITHSDKITLLGSCFSDEMLIHFQKAGFNVEGNPFGTIFHPIALTQLIDKVVQESDIQSNKIYQRNDLYFSWLASGSFYAKSKEQLITNVFESRKKFKECLLKSTILIVTLGTAWGYRLNDTGLLVANCHKAPSSKFTKELSQIEEMEEAWVNTLKGLNELNPSLKIIFTISPVRHIKDGLIENSRSKARLVELVNRIEMKTSFVHYFPASELVLDCLRDYRFFKSDLVHPSEAAVQCVWDFFKTSYFSIQTQDLSKEVWKLHQETEHKSLYADSESERVFRANFEIKKAVFFTKNPEITWY